MPAEHTQYYNEVFSEIKRWIRNKHPMFSHTHIFPSSNFIDLGVANISPSWREKLSHHLQKHFKIAPISLNKLRDVATVEDLINIIVYYIPIKNAPPL